ncbi:hypothetical protein E8E11_010442 [Didymella keratinophila]|nr:hypothetical protein E8E11_010442 [Didymella keratinophila]
MAFATYSPHGGGYVPNGSAFVQSNLRPTYQPAHGGGFFPSSPFQAGPVPSQTSTPHGGAFNPNSPFASYPVTAQPQPFAAPDPVYKPQFGIAVQETQNNYHSQSVQYKPKPNPLFQLCSCLR